MIWDVGFFHQSTILVQRKCLYGLIIYACTFVEEAVMVEIPTILEVFEKITVCTKGRHFYRIFSFFLYNTSQFSKLYFSLWKSMCQLLQNINNVSETCMDPSTCFWRQQSSLSTGDAYQDPQQISRIVLCKHESFHQWQLASTVPLPCVTEDKWYFRTEQFIHLKGHAALSSLTSSHASTPLSRMSINCLTYPCYMYELTHGSSS